MRFGRQLVVSLLASALLFNVSCTRKPSQLPRQASAPAETLPANLPPQISEATVPPAPPPPPPQPAPAEEPKPQPVKKHKRKTTTPGSTQTAGTNSPSGSSGGIGTGASNSLAVAHPPANPAAETAPDTAIAANATNAQLAQQKQTTSQLLDATEKALGSLTRTLSHDEEEIVAQVRSYMAQSRKATSEGDFERAYNLANKAHLLSDALVKK